MTNLKEKLEKLENSNIPVITGHGSNGYSVSIVNSNGNGKRISISKSLLADLSLSAEVYITPLVDDEFLVSNSSISNKTSMGKLSEKDSRICYSSGLVTLLVEHFKLDYSNKTSLAFNNITIEDLDGAKVAIVKIDADKCLKEPSGEED